MITVWGRPTSSNVQLVMWATAELGLEPHRIDVGGAFGGTDTAAFKAMNPNGLIPVMEDKDVVVFESAAILRYLAAKYGDASFWPDDPGKRAVLDSWAEWTKTTLCPVLIYQVFWTLVRTPSAERDLTALEQQVQKLGELMQLATNQIGENEFLCGNTLSFADIMFGHTLFRYYTLPISRPDLPILQAYYERISSREAYKNHVMIDYSSLQVE